MARQPRLCHVARSMLTRCAIAVLAVMSLAAAGCSDDGEDPCGEPVYAGEASDEAFEAIVDAEDAAAVGDPNAATITEPAGGATVSAAGAAPTITWTSPIAFGPRVDAPEGEAHAGLWDVLAELVEGTAHAHLPPVTGDIHDLKIDIPGRECPYRVLTTELSWPVDGPGWEAMRAVSGQSVTVRILSAYLEDNRVTEGPYAPAAGHSFMIGP